MDAVDHLFIGDAVFVRDAKEVNIERTKERINCLLLSVRSWQSLQKKVKGLDLRLTSFSICKMLKIATLHR